MKPDLTFSSRGISEPRSLPCIEQGNVLPVVWFRPCLQPSADGGLTLSAPTEFKFADGGRAPSYSAVGKFFWHPGTGKLYWLD